MALSFDKPAPFKDNKARNRWLANEISVKTWRTESGRTIMKAIRASGVKIRDSTFWGIRRNVLGLQKHEEAIRKLTPGNIVPKSMMVVNPNVSLSMQAQYRFTALKTDNRTGETTEISRAVATNFHFTPDQAIEAAHDVHSEPEGDSDWTISNVALFQVWLRQDAKLQ